MDIVCVLCQRPPFPPRAAVLFARFLRGSHARRRGSQLLPKKAQSASSTHMERERSNVEAGFMAGRPKIPDNWKELDLIPADIVIRGSDVNLKLGPLVAATATAFAGCSGRQCTSVLQVFKPILLAVGVQHFPYNVDALRGRLGQQEFLANKVHVLAETQSTTHSISCSRHTGQIFVPTAGSGRKSQSKQDTTKTQPANVALRFAMLE